MVDDERFMIAEVAVGEAVHQAVAERVKLVRGAWLRNADAAAAGQGEGCDGDVRGSREGGVGRVWSSPRGT